MMTEREKLLAKLSGAIPADDLMVANAQTSRAFSARIVGHFERLGANSWDPSKFVEEEGAEIRVFPGVKVEVEDALAWFHMRYRGGVYVFEWAPGEGELPAEADLHATFIETCVSSFRNEGGRGVVGMIARKLDG